MCEIGMTFIEEGTHRANHGTEAAAALLHSSLHMPSEALRSRDEMSSCRSLPERSRKKQKEVAALNMLE